MYSKRVLTFICAHAQVFSQEIELRRFPMQTKGEIHIKCKYTYACKNNFEVLTDNTMTNAIAFSRAFPTSGKQDRTKRP